MDQPGTSLREHGYDEQVGIRNQMRARWRGLPDTTRWGITVGIEVVVAIVLYALDASLGVGFLLVAASLWLRRLAPIPWRLAGEALVVGFLVILAATGNTVW